MNTHDLPARELLEEEAAELVSGVDVETTCRLLITA
jgi:hypothetical protein